MKIFRSVPLQVAKCVVEDSYLLARRYCETDRRTAKDGGGDPYARRWNCSDSDINSRSLKAGRYTNAVK